MRLSRNFGPHTAIAVGMDHVESDAVTILACDLQDPPETILEFVDAWQNGAQIVWGQRRTRQGPTWRTAASSFMTVLLHRYSDLKASKFITGSFLLMDRRVVSAVKQMGENKRITFAIVAWTGFEQKQIPYDRTKRQAGTSK
ncbi:glycosyltransferase [Rhodospirillales bacterium]|nr:glycosyltransferase [Rhodospirillales bacterium]